MSAALRVLRVEPEALHTRDDARQACAEGRRLGFDQLSLAWSPASAPADALLVEPKAASARTALRPSADRAQAEAGAIAWLAAECRAHGLGLLIDVEPACVRRASALAGLHPHWFEQPAGGDLPDPRRPPGSADTLRLRSAGEGLLAEVRAWWALRLSGWLDAGAAGFHCVHHAGLPASFWAALIETVRAAHPGARFIAAPSGEAASLLACGFDAHALPVPVSAAEVEPHACAHDRIAARAAPLPLLAVARRRPVGAQAAEDTEPAHRRGLWWAAATGAGLMMPLGFERGLPPGQALRANGAAGPEFDLGNEVSAVNAWIAARSARLTHVNGAAPAPRLALLSAAGAPAAAVLIAEQRDLRRADRALLLLAGFGPAGAVTGADLLPGADRYTRFRALRFGTAESDAASDACEGFDAAATLQLDAGATLLYESQAVDSIVAPPTRAASAASRARRAIEVAQKAPRLVMEAITPSVDGGRFAVKRIAGELVRVEVDVFMDGHDKLAVVLLWRGPEPADWREVPMAALGNDRWRAEFPLASLGRHSFTIEAWRDVYESYRDELGKKLAAGLNVRLEVEEGRLLLVQAAGHAREQGNADAAATLDAIVATLGEPLAAGAGKSGASDEAGKAAKSGKPGKAAGKAAGKAGTKVARRNAVGDALAHAPVDADEPSPPLAARIETLLAAETQQAVRDAALRPFALRHEPALAVEAERTAARYASWYELFPRSIGNRPGEPLRHGTFIDVIERLPAIRAMGFDVLYFTPIHPIGRTNRKGRNNTLTPTPDDPGSPYAIGSEEGGHDAFHRELGTLDDFLALCSAAASHGLEIALDFAIQCSPDHPWLREHPEWFSWRPDGSMRYAENPPKKYQDIVNVDFYAEGARPALWTALRDVVLFWAGHGVRLFRVDNPHTKPLPFWEWLIADVRARHPDVVFLSEAFTRPKPMYRLAKVGFSQSYTYFTWRHTKQEFIDYLTELQEPSVAEVFRPHFFVNTPDINPVFLQRSGRAGFLIRAALATLMSGLWGMYSGFELCEGTPLPGKEEYLDSEKFELRAWDWQRPGHIIGEITLLNRIRRGNPALHSHLGIEFFAAANEHILWFARFVPARVERAGGSFGEQVLLVAINLDPANAQGAAVELPLWRFGLPDDGVLEAHDLVHDQRFAWHGKQQHLWLDPAQLPFAIWRVQPQ